jgi:Trk K+ transport system NAD-binding subunit
MARFGRAIARALEHAGLAYKAIDVDPVVCGVEAIAGSGLAEGALRRAGIEEPVGIVVATNEDARNLAVVATARRLKHKLFVVMRQNVVDNRSLIEAAQADFFSPAAATPRACSAAC